ncbi:MAG TPA: hypothetical protein PL193_01015 [Xanthobacteraceae bacterium]|nr:hypothetical protein [Xanthobacteraceae bacterium]
MKRLVIAGHSHAYAVTGRAASSVSEIRRITPRVDALIGPWPRAEDYWCELRRQSQDSIVALLWGGNEHNARFFFLPAQPFDFVVARRALLPIQVVFDLVPESLVRARFQPLKTSLVNFLYEFSELQKRNVLVVGTPPPKRDETALRQFIRSETHFRVWVDSRASPGDDIPINLPFIRLKLWLIVQDMLSEAAVAAGVRFLPVPKAACDADGFLLREYWAGDITHANLEYGNLLLAYVLDYCDREFEVG